MAEKMRDGWRLRDDLAAPADVEGLAAAHAALGAHGRITGWGQLRHADADMLARAFLADYAAAGGTDMAIFARHWVPRWNDHDPRVA